MIKSGRIWWIAGVSLAIAIFALLAAIAGGRSPDSESTDLAPGESEILRGRVVEVLEEGMVTQGGFSQPYQRLSLRIAEGALDGQLVEVEQGLLGLTNQSRLFQAGDRVLVEHTRGVDGQDLFLITDYVRTGPLLWLLFLFMVATVLVSGWQGLRSLAGMAISLVIIVGFIVPQILAGREPVTIAILGSVVMMGISLYLVYGWKAKTHVAVAGLFVSLILTGLLAILFVGWTRLSGFGAEEAGFLQVAGVQLNTRGLLLAGIIVGTLGALDDVAVGQAIPSVARYDGWARSHCGDGEYAIAGLCGGRLAAGAHAVGLHRVAGDHAQPGDHCRRDCADASRQSGSIGGCATDEPDRCIGRPTRGPQSRLMCRRDSGSSFASGSLL
jgi:hypothetical protein